MTDTLFDGIADETTEFNPSGPAAPFAWYGGKAYYAKWLISHFPQRRVYVEPFGGAGNVLLRMFPSDVEVFNDLDGRIVNFYRVLRDRKQFQELVRLLNLTPYSRKEFSCQADQPEPDDPVKRAWWFFVRLRQCLGGSGMGKVQPSYWATSTRSRRRMAEPVSKYLSAIDGLPDIVDRIATVMIECMPAIDLIRKYDGPDVFFYCDPPYMPNTRNPQTGTRYSYEMSVDDHRELLEVLLSVAGRVAISGYSCDLYDNLLASWRAERLKTKSRMSNSGQERVEMLWMNWKS